MPKGKKPNRPARGVASHSFARELATLNAGLAKLESSLSESKPSAGPGPRLQRLLEQARAARAHLATVSAIKPPVAPIPVAPTPVNPPRPSPSAPPPPVKPAAPPLPTGTDLAEPKNFGQMPPNEELNPGELPADEHQRRLSRHLAFANQVLHTSGVPAAVWLEWRAFQKNAEERLRQLHTVPHRAEAG
jgi:hypothetical protein